jgi:site-specific recombinase XerD
MRMHVGGKQAYKRISLKTSNKETVIARALDHWRNLKNHIDAGGSPFEIKISQAIEEYIASLQEMMNTEQIRKHTLQCKKTSLKKLKEYLAPYEKPSDIPRDIFQEYTSWRRSKNWTRYHKNNPKPPSDLTINKELTDFKSFFDWCSRQRIRTNDFEFPWRNYDPSKSKESSPPFTWEDYSLISHNLTVWFYDKDLRSRRKNNFYRGVFIHYFEILAQSGLRPHECLKLRWSDVEIISDFEKVNFRVWNSEECPHVEENEMLIGTMNGVQVLPDTNLMPPKKYLTMKTLDSIEEAIQKNRNWFEVEFVGAKIQVSADTKTGRRTVYSPAGRHFQMLWEHYKKYSPIKPKRNDYIFQNVGTTHSKGDDYVGKPLNDTSLRRLWYEFKEYLSHLEIEINHNYTLYSCRSFFININLEAGSQPHQVAKMVGHSVSTQSRHYEAMEVKKLATRFTKITSGQIKQSRLNTQFVDEL